MSDTTTGGSTNDAFVDLTGENADTGAADTRSTPDAQEADAVQDTTGADAAPAGDCPGGFGCACQNNADCLDEICIEGVDGRICSKTCIATCPDPERYDCVAGAGDVDGQSICVPRFTRLCRPCTTQSDCDSPGDPLPEFCVAAADPDEGSFCAASCANRDCPEGFSCVDAPVPGGATARQCVPDQGICDCRESWAEFGLTTGCAVTNEFGSCPGSRSCQAAGLSACDGTLPAAETCNGLDDDCDGTIDNIANASCTVENVHGSCDGTSRCDEDGQYCDAPEPAAEVCDGVDNDCDGQPDEGSCDDGLSCTVDTCDVLPAGGGQCSSAITEGFCVIDGACFADGDFDPSNACNQCLTAHSTDAWSQASSTCVIEGACVGDGFIKPDEPCLSCRPELTTMGWSPRAPDSACDDGDPCTYDDRCVANSCIGTATPDSCDDGLACTVDSCNGDSTCTNQRDAESCIIDGACVDAGTANPDNPCELCDPIVDPSAWSPAPDTTSCDDDSVCTVDDRCDGSSGCGGDPIVCDDQLDCTADSCDPESGCSSEPVNSCVIDGECVPGGDPKSDEETCLVCTPSEATAAWSVATGACHIDGACVAGGAVNPDDDCERCAPDDTAPVGDTIWRSVSVGTCGDPASCTAGGTCDDGVCVNAADICDDGLGCTSEACNGDGTCTVTTTAGNCVINDACYADGAENPENACEICASAGNPAGWSPNPARCVIDGVCIDAGTLNPENQCESCQPASSTSGWTPVALGGSCDDGNPCSDDEQCDGEGACAGDISCNDGLACTTDLCTQGGCVNFTDNDACVIEGACLLAGQDVGNSCLTCRPSSSQTALTPEAVTTSCDDANPCSTDDHCDGGGTCVGDTTCGDGLFCTDDVCTPGGCTNAIDAAWCVIDGACFGAGSDGGVQCRTCDPTASQQLWTLVDLGMPCDDGSPCSNDDHCDGKGECQGDTSCVDGVFCTLDVCDAEEGCSNPVAPGGCLIGGVCLPDTATAANGCLRCQPATSATDWTPTASGVSCDNGDACTQDATCDGEGACVGDNTCNDDDPCTLDQCEDDGCDHSQVVPGKCIIDGVCVDAGADVSNPCRTCAPSIDARAWTFLGSSTTCNDGSPCSTDDHCDGFGACVGDTSCDDGIACTENMCGAGGCTNPISEGACLIGGTCRSTGPHPSNACLTCSPTDDPTDWTPLGVTAPCNDGSACSTDDHCDGNGTCVGDTGCDDGKPCTVNQCEGAGCNFDTVADGWCQIDGACVAAGPNPSNGCLVCDPSESKTSWTPAPVTTLCSDGNACSTDDHCDGAGACTGDTSCNDGDSCTVDSCTAGGCDNSQITPGKCKIDGACFSAGANPQNPCELCQPETSQVQWTNASVATSCDDQNPCSDDDHCDGQGGCTGDTSCDDGVSCTENTCTLAGCRNTAILDGWCRIGQSCVPNNTPNPGNECEYCNSTLSKTQWSDRPTSWDCSDGSNCTSGDKCDGSGSCSPGAFCNDGVVCTTDVCVNNACSTVLTSNWCRISTVCYEDEAVNPTNSCLKCDDEQSTTGWSHRNGVACNDGNSCTDNDVCGGGSCSGTPNQDIYESNNSWGAAKYLGSKDDNRQWSDASSITGNLYGSGDVDWYRFRMKDNSNTDGEPDPRVELSNIPSGSNYDLCVYWKCVDRGDSDAISCNHGSAVTYTVGGTTYNGCCSTRTGTLTETAGFETQCDNAGFLGTDDETGDVYIRVYRVGGPWTCSDYTLKYGDESFLD